jgi:hypothetical protein
MAVPRHPVIPGFHPDPSVCRVGDDYFLVNSSFEYFPAVPIFRSTDLREWAQIGNVLTRPNQVHLATAWPSGGVYAPTIRHRDGRFWMITTNVSDPPGQMLVTAPDASGPWSDAVRIPDAIGIDPDLAWDDDGVCWLSWSGEDENGHGIATAPLDPATGELLDSPTIVWRGTGGQFPEGPHLYGRDGYWYLLIAEGGTERGHAITVARGPSPRGPFTAGDGNPLLTARGTDWPIQNTGHGDLVERPDGRWAMVFLAARPRGFTPSWHVLGRETFAVEIEWVDGWPRLGEAIEGTADEATERLTTRIPIGWVAPGRDPADVLRYGEEGWILNGPAFVGRRQEHFFIDVAAQLDPSDDGSLEIRIDPEHRVEVVQEGGRLTGVATIGGVPIALGQTETGRDATLRLRTVPPQVVGTPRQGPDNIVAGYESGGAFVELGRIDGRYLSTEVAGGFTGRMVGLRTEHRIRIRSFSYTGSDAARPPVDN